MHIDKNYFSWDAFKAGFYKRVERFRQSTLTEDTEVYNPLKGIIFGKAKMDSIRTDHPHHITIKAVAESSSHQLFGLSTLELSPELLATFNSTATNKNATIKYCIMANPRIFKDPKSGHLILGTNFSNLLAIYLISGLDFEAIPYEEWMENY